jgi:hypothetical protein
MGVLDRSVAGALRVRWQDQRMGPITIFDKSALQALSMDKAVWFDAFFLANVVPLFYVETLADLEKKVARGRKPEDIVGVLAEKTPSGAVPNVHHRQLILGELIGHMIEMTGQAVIGAGDVKRAPDGSVGVHVDEFPEEAALLRWKNHDFLEIERTFAKGWRAELAEHDADRLIGVLKNILPSDAKISDLERLKAFIDSFSSSNEPEVIELALEVLGVPDEYKRFALARWEAEGKPPLDEFVPYTMHVFTVDLLFYLGIHRGFISGDRASNKADMAYLYYLPFAMVFVSGDRLHRRTVPLLLREDQSYLHIDEFKQALRELDEHFNGLPEEIKQLGVLQFASYPPSDMDNAVTRLWDKHMRPDWREVARRQEAELGKPRDEDTGRETVAEVRRRFEEARPVTDQEASLAGAGPDYFVIRRQVPVKKGKWRMVSKEVEEAEGET